MQPRRAALWSVLAVASALMAVLFLRTIASPRTSELCRSSPWPYACQILLPAGGATAPTADLGTTLTPNDGPALDHSPGPETPLVAGQEALRHRWYATAYRHCQDAAEAGGEQRAAALICQGRAALNLGWLARATYLAQRAIEIDERASALVLLGDAYRVQKDCRQARPAYLRALELAAEDPEALSGLQQCAGDPSPPADSEVQPPRERQPAGQA